MPDAVALPVLDLPEWAETTLQVLSLGAFTPRSAERRALEAAARVDLLATELSFEQAAATPGDK